MKAFLQGAEREEYWSLAPIGQFELGLKILVEADARASIAVGSVINDRYEILAYVGQGGMGIVYKARDRRSDKLVALKLLFADRVPDAKSVARFQQEADAASSLHHPCLTRVYDSGIAESGQPYLVLEFVEGNTLAEKLAQEGQLSIDETIRIFIDVCEGLEHAHGHQIVHRDLKPSNIMLSIHGDRESVKVLDFGLAKMQRPADEQSLEITRTGQLVGSPFYMSPEQARGSEVDHRSDLYSLGCSMYEALTGGPPHIGTSPMSTLMKRESDAPLTLAQGSLGKSFPEAVEHVIARLLNRVPEERFQSAREVKEELLRLQKGEPIRSPRPTAAIQSPGASHSPSRSNVPMIICASFIFVLVAAGLFVTNSISSLKQKQASVNASVDEDRFGLLPMGLPNEVPALPATAMPEVLVCREQRMKGDYQAAASTLMNAIRRYTKELGPNSAATASLYTELGETYIGWGQMEKAYDALTKAYEIVLVAPSEMSLPLANAIYLLAEFYNNPSPEVRRKFVERRLELYNCAAEIYERLPTPRPVLAGECLLEVGDILAAKGDYVHAEANYRKAVNLLGGPSREAKVKDELFIASRRLSDCCRHQNRFVEALECDTQALESVQSNSQPDVLQQCILHNAVAADNLSIAKSAEPSVDNDHLLAAEANYKRSLELAKDQQVRHQSRRMEAFEGLGNVYTKLSKANPSYIEQADDCYRKALELCQSGDQNLEVAKYEKLSRLYLVAGNLRSQGRYFMLALNSSGSTSMDVIYDQTKAVAYHRSANNIETAKSICTRLLDTTKGLYGRESIGYADMCVWMGKLCQAEKKPREAENYFHRAFAIYQKKLGAQDVRTKEVTGLLGG